MELNKMQRVFSDRESKEIDKYAIQEHKLSPILLMGMAAVSIFQEYKSFFEGKEIVILCGSGNNGGDGLALAHLLYNDSHDVKVFRKIGEHTREYNYYLELLEQTEVKISQLEDFLDYANHKNQFDGIIIDCLLGIGFKPPLSEFYSKLINAINTFKALNPSCEIISVDSVSGFSLSQNTDFIDADILAEIGVKKLNGIFLLEKLKRYSFHSIGFPVEKYLKEYPVSHNNFSISSLSINTLKNEAKRSLYSHKFSNGSVSFIGGSTGMLGAILSSVYAFHGLGGGISKIFSPSKDCINSILKKDESLMPDLLTEESIQDAFLHKCDVIAIGPGLKPDEQKLNVQSLISMNKRIIIDSGGLESVKQISLNENVILTPHPGEFKRLIDATHSTTMDLLEQIRQYCLSCNVNLIYRGSFTILCNPRGDLYIWNYPNPKLAVMGTGDVFVGILSYFAAKKDSILDAFHLTMSAMEISRMMKGTYPSATEINTFINEVIHNG